MIYFQPPTKNKQKTVLFPISSKCFVLFEAVVIQKIAQICLQVPNPIKSIILISCLSRDVYHNTSYKLPYMNLYKIKKYDSQNLPIFLNFV